MKMNIGLNKDNQKAINDLVVLSRKLNFDFKESILDYNSNSGYTYIFSENESYQIGFSDFRDYPEIIISDFNTGDEFGLEIKRFSKTIFSKIEKAFSILEKENLSHEKKREKLEKLNFDLI